jgi:hypothetical protein
MRRPRFRHWTAWMEILRCSPENPAMLTNSLRRATRHTPRRGRLLLPALLSGRIHVSLNRRKSKEPMRGAQVRIEVRLDGSMAVRFRDSLVGSGRMFGAPQSSGASQKAQEACLRPTTEESVDEELLLHHPDKAALSAAPANPIGQAGPRRPGHRRVSVFKASAR